MFIWHDDNHLRRSTMTGRLLQIMQIANGALQNARFAINVTYNCLDYQYYSRLSRYCSELTQKEDLPRWRPVSGRRVSGSQSPLLKGVPIMLRRMFSVSCVAASLALLAFLEASVVQAGPSSGGRSYQYRVGADYSYSNSYSTTYSPPATVVTPNVAPANNPEALSTLPMPPR